MIFKPISYAKKHIFKINKLSKRSFLTLFLPQKKHKKHIFYVVEQ